MFTGKKLTILTPKFEHLLSYDKVGSYLLK